LFPGAGIQALISSLGKDILHVFRKVNRNVTVKWGANAATGKMGLA